MLIFNELQNTSLAVRRLPDEGSPADCWITLGTEDVATSNVRSLRVCARRDDGCSIPLARYRAPSIDIGLGKRERIAQQFEARLRVLRDDYLDDVETKKNIWIIQKPEPGKTAARNSFLLGAIDGVEWTSEIFARPRFHFDEDKGVVVAANDVDFAPAPAAKITIEDFVTVPPQKAARQFLPASPKPKMFGTRRRKPAAPPVRKIGDESDKARAHAI